MFGYAGAPPAQDKIKDSESRAQRLFEKYSFSGLGYAEAPPAKTASNIEKLAAERQMFMIFLRPGAVGGEILCAEVKNRAGNIAVCGN